MKQYLLMAAIFLTIGTVNAQKNQNTSKKLNYKTYSRTEKDGSKTYLDINNENDSLGMRALEITYNCGGKVYSDTYKLKGNSIGATMLGIAKGQMFTVTFEANKIELVTNSLIPENICKNFDGVYILTINK